MNKKTPDNWTNFRMLVFTRQFDKAAEMIRTDGDTLNARNSLGETVLHYLAVENDLEGVGWLKSQGADLNTQNKFGSPPVFEVAQLGYKELLKWFVENGADLSIRDKEDRDIRTYLEEYNIKKMIQYLDEITE